MRAPQFLPLTLCLALGFVLSLTAARAADDPWPDIQAGVFAGRAIAENDGALSLYAPEQAEDAAIVPIAVHLPADIANQAKSLTLIIDRNPAPVAATFRFGDAFHAAADIGERKIMTRVRVDAFSKVRAILETADGKLHMATKFVMAAGGCSAPASKDADAALASLGRMQVKSIAEPARGERWREGIVMIRHPNFTGMQMDIVSRGLYAGALRRRRRGDARRRPRAADGRRHLDLRGSEHPLQLRRGRRRCPRGACDRHRRRQVRRQVAAQRFLIVGTNGRFSLR